MVCSGLYTAVLPIDVFHVSQNPTDLIKFDPQPVGCPVPLGLWQWSQPLLSVCCVLTRPDARQIGNRSEPWTWKSMEKSPSINYPLTIYQPSINYP